MQSNVSDGPSEPLPHIALITLDSLRYDVACRARTPRLDAVLDRCAAGRWRSVYCNGDYTLPSHVAMLQGGRLPSNFGDEPIYNHARKSAFRIVLPWKDTKDSLYLLPHAPNLVRGFEQLGFRTVGVGGVGWFDTRCQTTAFWKERYFQEFDWKEDFHEGNPQALEAQLDHAESLDLRDGRPLFYFQNVASTHTPYRGKGLSKDPERDLQSQIECMEYIDQHLPRLMELLPRPIHVFLLADHGECFGEDGQWGHGIAHPKVHEVPMVHFLLHD